MNNVLRKALSFITAVAVGSSVLLSGGITAAAATASPTVKQVVKDENDLAIGLKDGAFFVSKAVQKEVKSADSDYTYNVYCADKNATITVVDANGKATKLKNTIGFDKLYVTNTFGGVMSVREKTTEGNQSCVVVGVKDKYAVILNTGKYLANGKTFDDVSVYNSIIKTVSGKTSTIYTTAGKKILSSTQQNLGYCIDYDPKGKTALFLFYGDNEGNEPAIKMVNSKGKVLQKFTNKNNWFHPRGNYASYYTTKKGTVLVRAYMDGVATYYNSNGKKVSVKEEAATASANGAKYTSATEWDYENKCYISNIYNKKGDVIYTLNDVLPWADIGDNPKDGNSSNCFIIIGDRLVWVDGAFHVYDLKNKKMIVEKTDKSYYDIRCINGNSLAVGNYEVETVEDTYNDYVYDEETGEYVIEEKTETYTRRNLKGYCLMSTSGKLLNKKLFADVKTVSKSYAVMNSSEKWALVSAVGKEYTTFKYAGVYADLGSACIMTNTDETYSILNTTNGKVLKSKFRIASSYGYGIGEDYYSLRICGKKNYRILTENKAGTKYGLLYIKT